MKMSPFQTRTARGNRRRPAPRTRLAVETLESRWVPSQLTNSLGIGALKDVHFNPPASGGGITAAAGPSFQVISQPIAPYLAETSKLNITVADGTSVASLNDGSLTAFFSPSGLAATVPTTWLSWASPPDSESATPRILTFIGATSETILLDSPVLTFGVEVEPNQFTPSFTVTATFADNGGNVLGTISRDVSGQAGSRLFAGTDLSGTGISSVVITIDAAAQGFAIGQFRYSFNNYSLAGPYVSASAPTAPVNTLDHVTVTFNQPTDPTTFTADQVSLTDPNGNPVTITQDNIVPNADGTVYTISFDPQTTLGQYSLSVGPNITDLNGNPMDQNFDGIPGEDNDVYMATFTVTNELVVNGGFETGNFSGWTQSGGTDFTSVTADLPHSGSFAAHLGPTTEGFIAQNLATTAGTTYSLSYWLENDGNTPNSFRAMIDGVDVLGSVLNNAAAQPYTLYTFTFMAAGTSTQLKFGFLQVPAYWNLDDISVMPTGGSPIPGGHRAPAAEASLAPAVLTTAHVVPITFDHLSMSTKLVSDEGSVSHDEYVAVPATPLQPVATLLHAAPVNPAVEPLDLSGGFDGWTL